MDLTATTSIVETNTEVEIVVLVSRLDYRENFWYTCVIEDEYLVGSWANIQNYLCMIIQEHAKEGLTVANLKFEVM